MKETAEKYPRLKYIDYLKAIAIVLIIITHNPWVLENRDGNLIFPLLIDMAVPIFMILSGFNYAYSCCKKNMNTFKEHYRIKNIKDRLLRFLIPFGVTFIGEVLLLTIYKKKNYSISSLSIDLLTGGYGPGAYYTPIMIQFIFIAPLIYILIKKYEKIGVWIVFGLNFLFECFYTLFGMPPAGYRYWIIRYTFLIALGIGWYEIGRKKQKWFPYVISFLIGVTYLLGTTFYYTPVIFVRWTNTSMLAGLYIFPLMSLFVKLVEKVKLPIFIEKFIQWCSESTFHIFLFQMVYYYLGVGRLFEATPKCLHLLCDVTVCILMGCFFNVLMIKVLRKKRTI